MRYFKTIIFGIVIFLVACGENYSEIEPNISETVAEFSATTQDNDILNLNDLSGKWWVADFIFTNCTTVCLPMTHHMTVLQDKLIEEDLPIELISFSVDPYYDTPDVLKAYAVDYDVNLNNWTFLTGYDFQTIRELSIKSFRSLLQEAERGSDQVTHGTEFMLVSPEGKLIKKYDGLKLEEIDNIIADLKVLQRNGHL